ncbi:potassium voltage-gated channel unc-103 isoform X1 [Hydra vulgaris]|uniref:potassium voltage-gated channel unc-103 isoform X1 n=1 Tax=Hydra vulgaris TaxID=6087 RepID=UPI0001926853|nr:potassium voltage-gated channel unc-103 [Hydra vulgaris]XP_047136916.1 potassium voltage-gated channel unc-103 [Hydra vulgaris]
MSMNRVSRKSRVMSHTLLRSTISVFKVMSLGSDIFPPIKCNQKKINSFIILHYSVYKAIWDWFILLLVMYTAIATPYMVTFLSGTNKLLTLIDTVIDFIFLIDILLNFRTSFVDSSNEVVYNPYRIAKNYLKGWFILDFLAAFPFQLICLILKTNQTTVLISLGKSARLRRLVRITRKVDMYSEYNIALLLLLVFGFTLIAHWFACLWYAIGVKECTSQNNLGWLAKLNNDLNNTYNRTEGLDLTTTYLTALYFTLSSMTSVGFGNVSANTNIERLFTIIIMLAGALMYAIIFGNITAIIHRLYSGLARYHSTMRRVRRFIRFYQIPSPLRQRLEDYSQYDYSYTNGIDMNEILSHFPEGLQAEVCLHLNRNLFARNLAFRGVPPGCLRTLSLKLKTTRYTPGNYIIHYGDEIVNLMWIERGTLEVLQGDKVIFVLGKCDSFGENFGAVYDRLVGKSCASVRALTYCDIQSISREDMLSSMRAYPEFHRSFNRNFKVSFNLRDLELEEKDLSSSLCNLSQQRQDVLEKLKQKNSIKSNTKKFNKKTNCRIDNSLNREVNRDSVISADSVMSDYSLASKLVSSQNLFSGHSIYVTDHSTYEENPLNKENGNFYPSLREKQKEKELDQLRLWLDNFEKAKGDILAILKLLKFESEKISLKNSRSFKASLEVPKKRKKSI